jgi:hypothetical protein
MRTATRGLLALTLALLLGWPAGSASSPHLVAARHSAAKIKLRTAHSPTRPAAPAWHAAVSDLLAYNGGRVLSAPRVYLSFWGPDWSSPSLRPAQDYVTSFFESAGGSDWADSMTQYCAGRLDPPYTACTGSQLQPITNPTGQLGGSWIDPTPVTYVSPAANCGLPGLLDAGDCDVMSAAARASQHFGSLPTGAMVMVVTPSGLSQPGFSSGGWCAYHWAIPVSGRLPSAGLPFGYLPYMPDAGASCGANSVNSGPQGAFDGFSIIGGHEYAETITDPNPGTGWLDGFGAENGDKCAWQNVGNRSFGGRQLAVQPLWSNAVGGCVSSGGGTVKFQSLGGALKSRPASASWGGGHLDLLGRGDDDSLWHQSWNGSSWSGRESLGGVLTSEPAAATWGPNRLDVFARGTDGGLWHQWGNGGSWSGWEPLGGIVKDAPAAASWSGNRLDVFIRGTDDGLWHRWWDGGGWQGWEPLGGSLTSSPSAVAWGANRLDVFARGNDGALWSRSWDGGGWSGWLSLGGRLGTAATAASRAPNRIEVFALGLDSGLLRQVWDGVRWSGWMPLGGKWLTAPSAVSQPGTGTVDIFEVGPNHDLEQATLA